MRPISASFTGAVVFPIADISCWFLRTTADLTMGTLEMKLLGVFEIVGSQAKLSNKEFKEHFMKRTVVIGLIFAASVCGWAADPAASSVAIGQPSVFWHDNQWETYHDGVWVPYGQSVTNAMTGPDAVAPAGVADTPPAGPNGRRRGHFARVPSGYGRLNDTGGTPGAPTGQPHVGIGQYNLGMGQPSIGIGQPNVGVGQPNIGIGQPNIGVGQPNIGIGQPNIGVGQPNLGVGKPNIGVGQPNIGVGKPNIGVGQPNIGVGKPNIGTGKPNFGVGQPNIGIGKPSTAIGQTPQVVHRPNNNSFNHD